MNCNYCTVLYELYCLRTIIDNVIDTGLVMKLENRHTAVLQSMIN